MSEGFTITARIRPSVDTTDAVVCAKLLEIWLNENRERRVEVTFTDDGKAEINLAESQKEEPPKPSIRLPLDPDDLSALPW